MITPSRLPRSKRLVTSFSSGHTSEIVHLDVVVVRSGSYSSSGWVESEGGDGLKKGKLEERRGSLVPVNRRRSCRRESQKEL